MATIYRFIVENKTTEGGGRKGGTGGTKGAGKKGKTTTLLHSMKGGVESNRKMRAINPLLNKVTGGVWEKSVRITRATAGLVKKNTETGKISFSGPSIAILVAFVLMTVWNAFAKWNAHARQEAEKLNSQNFKAMENGSGTVHGSYKISSSWWAGQLTYNQNKQVVLLWHTIEFIIM